MATRHNYKFFDAIDMTAPNEWTLPTSTNYGFFIQANWTGLIGTAKWKVQASNDGVVWDDYAQFLPLTQEIVVDRELTGATGVSSFENDEWFPDHIKVVYDNDTASAGTITFTITMINKQDVQ